MSWPETHNLPAQALPPWGEFVKPGDMSFPFKVPYWRTDKKGIVVDFQFSGGTLQGAGFPGKTKYFMDGFASSTATAAPYAPADVGRSGCYATGGTATPIVRLGGETILVPKTQFTAYFQAANIPPNAPFFTVLAFGGDNPLTSTGSPTPGTPMSGSCINLHVTTGLLANP